MRFSIIIPVYNCRDCFCHCLDSIVSQPFKDYELILVDDGSTDGSSAICDEYAGLHPQIRVIHQANAGVSKARNAGLSIAQGDYVTFVDADDMVSTDYLSDLSQKVSEEYDFLVFSVCHVYRDGASLIHILSEHKYQGSEQIEQGLRQIKTTNAGDMFGMLFNKVYRRSIIVENKLLFPEDIWFREDEIFVYRYAGYCHTMQVISDVLYQYIENEKSLSSRERVSRDYERLADHLFAFSAELSDAEFRSREVRRSLCYLLAAFNVESSWMRRWQLVRKMKNELRMHETAIQNRKLKVPFFDVIELSFRFPLLLTFPILSLCCRMKGNALRLVNI